ncbi:hypothetical protein WJX75_003122 [Coccomyxa subellipsoidea]|uniref:Uncharacterized protein n=1 Tax=Coccomyxa subellipsoidea TaxID=248742 RepID=A0ABR2Z073_9CHLO
MKLEWINPNTSSVYDYSMEADNAYYLTATSGFYPGEFGFFSSGTETTNWIGYIAVSKPLGKEEKRDIVVVFRGTQAKTDEDKLCFLTELSPGSDDPQYTSQRLRVELSKNLPIKRGFLARSVNVLATSEFTVSACVHGEGQLRSICIRVSSVQSTVACQDESINETLFLSSSSLEVRAACGSTEHLELQMALDERNPGCELRILRHDIAPFDIPAGDGVTCSKVVSLVAAVEGGSS